MDNIRNIFKPWRALQLAKLNTKRFPGCKVQKCQETACTDTYVAFLFARDIIGADIEYYRAHMGEYYRNLYDEMIMQKVLGSSE